MSPMSLKHTKSPSGKTHRLTHTTAHPNPIVTSVTLRYRERPQFDDQVQGDLLRKMQAEHNLAYGVGRLGTYIDADLLDRGQQAPSLEYLRGYLAGLSTNQFANRAAIERTREHIARLEAAQNDAIQVTQLWSGGAPILPGGGPAAGSGAMQVNSPTEAEIARRDLMRRRAERGGR